MPIIKPEAAGWEASVPPLCYAPQTPKGFFPVQSFQVLAEMHHHWFSLFNVKIEFSSCAAKHALAAENGSTSLLHFLRLFHERRFHRDVVRGHPDEARTRKQNVLRLGLLLGSSPGGRHHSRQLLLLVLLVMRRQLLTSDADQDASVRPLRLFSFEKNVLGGLSEDVPRSGHHFVSRPLPDELLALNPENFSRIERNDLELRRLGQRGHDFERMSHFRLDRDGAEPVKVESLFQSRVLFFQLHVLLVKKKVGLLQMLHQNEKLPS